MENREDVRRQRAEDEWDDLEREEVDLLASIAAHQSAIAKDERQLKRVRDYKDAHRAFHFREDFSDEPMPNFEPGGSCPIPMTELQAMDSYQSALRSIGKASLGGYVHGRTAGEWLIAAEILTGLTVDEARMRVSKYMARAREWEKVEGRRGWYRYLPEFDTGGTADSTEGDDVSGPVRGEKHPR